MFKIKYESKCEVFDRAVKVSIVPITENNKFMSALAVYFNINQERFPSFQKCRPDVFVGIARLKENDVSNVELGKEIAFRKAKRQMYSFYCNVMKEMKDDFDRHMLELEEDIADLSDQRLEVIKEIKTLAK